MRRSGTIIQPSTLAVDRVVADRVREAARKSGLSILAYTSALLEAALDRGAEIESSRVTVRLGDAPSKKRGR